MFLIEKNRLNSVINMLKNVFKDPQRDRNGANDDKKHRKRNLNLGHDNRHEFQVSVVFVVLIVVVVVVFTTSTAVERLGVVVFVVFGIVLIVLGDGQSAEGAGARGGQESS